MPVITLGKTPENRGKTPGMPEVFPKVIWIFYCSGGEVFG
jgi:hypothetical protein